MWVAFLRRSRLEAGLNFKVVLDSIKDVLEPVFGKLKQEK